MSQSEIADGRIRILHIIDKLSNDGSGMHGPACQLTYRLPLYPQEQFGTRVLSLRSDQAALQVFGEHGISARCLCRSKFDLRAYGDITSEIHGFGPHILHLHGYASQAMGRVVGRLRRIPTVIQGHAILPDIPLYERLADFLLGRMQTAALAVSQGVVDFLRSQRFVRGEVEVIWNGVPDAVFENPVPAETVAAVRRELGMAPAQQAVGMVCRLARGKGHMTFLDAAARIHTAYPNVRFLIIGEGPCRTQIENRIRELGLESSVFLTGFRTDTLQIMAMLNAHVIASSLEGFPGVAVENLAARTPMICTDIGAFNGFVEHERDCLKVPVGDADALAEAVLRVLNDQDEARARVACGFKTAEQCRMSRIAGAYLALYRRLIES